jgi:hypothetical protein
MLAELLEKAGERDFLRAVAEAVLQLLMETDVEGVIGAGRYERSGERTTWRNGYRDRTLDARLGALQIFVCSARSLHTFQWVDFATTGECLRAGPFSFLLNQLLSSLALWSCGRRVSVVQAQRQIHRAFKPHWSGSQSFMTSWIALVSPLRADPKLATRSRRHGHTGRPVTREPARRCGRSPKRSRPSRGRSRW